MGAAKQSDLAGMDRLVEGAKKECPELDRIRGVGHLCRFRQNFWRELLDAIHRFAVDAVQDGHHFLTGVGFCPVEGGGAGACVAFSQGAGHQLQIHFGTPPLAEQHQPVLCDRQMADLPGKMRWQTRRGHRPKRVRHPLQQGERIVPRELHLSEHCIPHRNELCGG